MERVQVAVRDHGIEALKKAAEEVTPGDKSDYYFKVRDSTNLVVGATPTITNLVMGTAGNQSGHAFQANTKHFILKARGNSVLQFAYTTGQTNTTFVTVDRGTVYEQDGILLISGTIYLQATVTGETIEILEWS